MNADANQVCLEFLRIWNQMKLALGTIAEAHGVTIQQAHALYELYTFGDMPMGTLAKKLQCDASNITGIVDRLVVSSLVDRTEDPDDRRTKQLRLTAKGKRLAMEILRKLPTELGFTHLNMRECAAFHEAFTKLPFDVPVTIS